MERLAFFWFPVILGILEVLISAWCVIRSRRWWQAVLGLIVAATSIWGVWILIRIFQGAWPTFIPHVAIFVVIPIVGLQLLLLYVQEEEWHWDQQGH